MRDAPAIRRWLDRVETRYQPRYQVMSAQTVADNTMVSIVVSGTFAGSPLELRQIFETRHGKITRLETL